MANAFQWYNDLTPKWRGVILFTSIGIGVFTIYEVIKWYNDSKNAAKSQAEVVGFAGDLATLQSQGVNPSYQQSQYQQWADSIQQTLTGKDWSFAICSPVLEYSNDGDAVASIVSKLQNNADFLALQTAWGTRTVNKGFLESNYTNVTLSGAFAAQFQSCEIDGFNAILSGNGITYTF